MPNPPLITSPHPTPPPLWIETHVAPLNASPITLWIAISAVNIEPSEIFEVSLKGESVPLTSWWSRPRTTGAEILPSWIALLNSRAIAILPSQSAYNILACDPTTSLFFCASLIQLILSASWVCIRGWAFLYNPSRTSTAIRSVISRSFGSFEVHTHLNGPNP